MISYLLTFIPLGAILTFIPLGVLMLIVLYDNKTKQDGLTLCLLWLSKALYAVAHGWARMRLGIVAAVGAAMRETRTAWKEAV